MFRGIGHFLPTSLDLVSIGRVSTYEVSLLASFDSCAAPRLQEFHASRMDAPMPSLPMMIISYMQLKMDNRLTRDFILPQLLVSYLVAKPIVGTHGPILKQLEISQVEFGSAVVEVFGYRDRPVP
jgi:hypothetical protein